MSLHAFCNVGPPCRWLRAPVVFTMIFSAVLFAPYAHGFDYFTAHADPTLKNYLAQLENNHLHRSPSNPGGIVANIAQGKYHAAAGGLEFILERFPNHPRALELAAVLAKLSKKTSLATAYFNKAVSQYPQYGLTHAQYGKYLVEIDLADQGIRRLKQAIELDPKLVVSYVLLAKALAKKGDAKLAQETAEQARQLGYKEKILGDGP